MSDDYDPSYIIRGSTTSATGTYHYRDSSDYSSNDTSAESGSRIWTVPIPDSVWIKRSKEIVRVLNGHQGNLKKDLRCHDGFLLCKPWLNEILNNLGNLGGYLQKLEDPILENDCEEAIQRFKIANIKLQLCITQEEEDQEIQNYMCRSEERQQRMAELEWEFKAAVTKANERLDIVTLKVNGIGQRITEVSE